MANENVLIGVIGGSGLYHLDNLTFVKKVNPETPWGFPSSPITISSLPSGAHIAFLARHGAHHTLSPSSLPSRANIAALKSLGVRVVLAFSAVGSLREEIPPGAFVLPTQVIDRTKGVRPVSFFEGTSVVAHAAFGDPFCGGLVRWLEGRVRRVLEGLGEGEAGEGGLGKREVFTDKCIICMEGPQFSTRAESIMYRQWGADLINMSVLPEAKLAREAEISYALIATATDYDSWRPHSASVTAADVFATLKANAHVSRLVAAIVIEELHTAITSGGVSVPSGKAEGEEEEESIADVIGKERGSMKYSIMPRSNAQDPQDRKKLAFVLPEYFGDVEGGERVGDVGDVLKN
ncbi:Methylthioadenosine phosphorylase [Collybia nuda]|uniref:S-methyl-5'-thioadenosine phosphorylase n=1 Tax=Collybia nuda TaxID=64659 RepID=A0A9P5XV68_9AGAR|nr:Methylthioadenosine phosphorylase [Collybia nuda]